jgi:hypothetical protein
MSCKTVGFAAISTLLIMPAHAEMGRGPGPGKAYISIEGGYQQSDGPAVASHGDLGTINGDNPTTASEAGVLSRPDGNTTALATQVDADGQIIRADNTGAPATTTILATTSAPGGSPSASAFLNAQNDVASFVDAFVDVFSDPDGKEAFAEAQGGNSTIESKHGAYGALTFGYAFERPFYGIFDRVEVYGSISRSDESQHVDGAAGAVSVDGTSGFAAAAILPTDITPQFVAADGELVTIGAVSTDVKQSVDFAEFGARLKADRWSYNSALLTAGLEGFYAIYNQDTDMRASVGGTVGEHIGSFFSRSADVDSNMVGVLASLEGQLPIGGTPLSLIGRTFGGFYYLNADGDFRDNFGLANVSDDLNSWGYRVGVEGGIRYDFSSRTSLSVTGSIDHFSDVATADLPRFAGEVARVDTDDLTNYRVGARLTVTLGDEPAPFK